MPKVKKRCRMRWDPLQMEKAMEEVAGGKNSVNKIWYSHNVTSIKIFYPYYMTAYVVKSRKASHLDHTLYWQRKRKTCWKNGCWRCVGLDMDVQLKNWDLLYKKQDEGVVTGEVTGWRRLSDIPGKGLEVPCQYTYRGKAKLVKKLSDLHIHEYFYPPSRWSKLLLPDSFWCVWWTTAPPDQLKHW